MQSLLGLGLGPRTGRFPKHETHNEQDDQEPHADVAKDEPSHRDSVAGEPSGRFSNLCKGEVAEDDCQQRGREKKERNPADQAGDSFPVDSRPVFVWRVADRGLQRRSAMLAGPRTLLMLRPTSYASHWNHQFEPVARTSYAPAALYTMNMPPEQGPEMSVGFRLPTRHVRARLSHSCQLRLRLRVRCYGSSSPVLSGLHDLRIKK
jgi:hypothetical protein